MPYYNLNPIQQLNFQMNRVLTYGEEAGNLKEISSIAGEINNIDEWFIQWHGIAQKAEDEGRYLHAAFYYRMAEFFLTDDKKEKEEMYGKCISNFYKVINDNGGKLEKYKIPYKGTYLPAMKIRAQDEKGTLLIHGGYDSFIEEFYLTAKEFTKFGYTIILFEGPGQGKALKNGLKFTHEWEKPVKAVLDYFKLNEVTLIGISWGGFLALRAAAFEPRIKRVVAYDEMYDGFDVMTNIMPFPVKQIFTLLFKLGAEDIINSFARQLMNKKLMAQWAISHGMYITGAKTPFEFYKMLSYHTMKGLTADVTQDVLLLAGEKDHYIPVRQYYRLKKELVNCRTLTTRLFTEKEGGEQHCQIGNHQLAVDEILNWLDSFNNHEV